jgi:hypothetical protein
MASAPRATAARREFALNELIMVVPCFSLF